MELEDLMEETIKHLEGDFYSKKFYFSYSSLNKLMWNPAAFYQLYVLGNKEEKTESYLVQGKVIHALLLEQEKFNELFIVSPGKLPGDNTRIIVDRVFAHHQEIAKSGDTRVNLEDFGNAILDIMKDMNYFQNLKTDNQRVEKVVTPEAINYWSFLKSKGNKTLIDQETFDFCQNAVDLIKSNKEVCQLIGCNTNEFSNVQVLNELPMQIELADETFGLKGIVDNLVIDHDKKTIFVNDIKTTGKDLKDFPETIEFFSYWLQAIIYVTMVTTNYKHLIDNGYKVKFHFVVIDKTFQTYAFPVSEATLEKWLSRLFDVLQKAAWHYQTKSYHLPYDFARGLVVL